MLYYLHTPRFLCSLFHHFIIIHYSAASEVFGSLENKAQVKLFVPRFIGYKTWCQKFACAFESSFRRYYLEYREKTGENTEFLSASSLRVVRLRVAKS